MCERTSRGRGADAVVNATFENYVQTQQEDSARDGDVDARSTIPAYLADKLVGHLGIKLEDKQSLLECTNPAERLERILGYMRRSSRSSR